MILNKKNVEEWLDDYDFISGMPRVMNFKWKKKTEANQGKTFLGFAADDLPDTVGEEKTGSVNVLGAVAYAYGAIKQLNKKVQELENRIKQLETNGGQ